MTAKTQVVSATVEPELLAEVKAVAEHLRELEARLNRRAHPSPGNGEARSADHAEVPKTNGMSDEARAEREAEDASQRVQRIISAAEATAAEIRTRAEADGARIREAVQAEGWRLFDAIDAWRPVAVELERALEGIRAALADVLDSDARD